MNGTFAIASATFALFGSVNTGFAPRTKSTGTCPARIRSIASVSSASVVIPSKLSIGCAGSTDRPTFPNF